MDCIFQWGFLVVLWFIAIRVRGIGGRQNQSVLGLVWQQNT